MQNISRSSKIWFAKCPWKLNLNIFVDSRKIFWLSGDIIYMWDWMQPFWRFICHGLFEKCHWHIYLVHIFLFPVSSHYLKFSNCLAQIQQNNLFNQYNTHHLIIWSVISLVSWLSWKSDACDSLSGLCSCIRPLPLSSLEQMNYSLLDGPRRPDC